MSHDDLLVVLIAAGCASAVGVVGLACAWVLRGASVRWFPAGVALVGVGAVVAAVIGTARAMFLSEHDYVVVLWVCLVAGIVSVGFGALVGAVVARSSRRLREGARRFAESGEYDARVAGPAEFVALDQQLRDTSRRLAEAREREQRLEDSRRELVSWVSHDLRTPLAGMRAMAEALEDGMVDDPARYHRQMRVEVDRTVRLVDDLFELSRIHAGRLHPDVQTVSLGDLVSESLAAAESVAASRGVRLGGRVEPDVALEADPAAISRVLANLVMNAIRHTPDDGSVQVSGGAVAGEVVLAVEDECGGIPDDEIARVFDVSFRGEHARTPSPDPHAGAGAGLGLAIVRGLVEAHRGRVEVRNVGRGCRFAVHLPVAAPGGPAQSAG